MVYVDGLTPCLPNRKWRFTKASHLIGDTEKELHEFAAQIGLKKAWFQGEHDIPHYDLSPGKYVKAIGAGAMNLKREEFFRIARRKGN